MYRIRSCSVRNARCLKALDGVLEFTLSAFNPLLKFFGHKRLDKPFVAVEKVIKGFLPDSQSWAQCIVGFTSMSCPMNCPKKMRNGPCGAVRDMINQLQEIEGVHGVHIMAFRQEQRVAEIVERSNVLHGRELWHLGVARGAEPALS